MKIRLDFDGVISDCGQLKSRGAWELFKMRIPPEHLKKELVVDGGLMSAEQYRELQKFVYGTRRIGLSMEPVSGALYYISQLIAEGHDVKVVTSRGEGELAIAQEWVVRHGLSKLSFVGVGYNGDKAKAVAGCDLYVDDDLDKLAPMVSIVPHLFLFSWGYNEHIDAGPVAQRVSSWKELYEKIQALSGGR